MRHGNCQLLVSDGVTWACAPSVCITVASAVKWGWEVGGWGVDGCCH